MSDREVFALNVTPKFELGKLRLTAGIDAKMKEVANCLGLSSTVKLRELKSELIKEERDK